MLSGRASGFCQALDTGTHSGSTGGFFPDSNLAVAPALPLLHIDSLDCAAVQRSQTAAFPNQHWRYTAT